MENSLQIMHWGYNLDPFPRNIELDHVNALEQSFFLYENSKLNHKLAEYPLSIPVSHYAPRLWGHGGWKRNKAHALEDLPSSREDK